MENDEKNRKPVKPMGPAVHGRKRTSLISKLYRKNHLDGTKPLVIIFMNMYLVFNETTLSPHYWCGFFLIFIKLYKIFEICFKI